MELHKVTKSPIKCLPPSIEVNFLQMFSAQKNVTYTRSFEIKLWNSDQTVHIVLVFDKRVNSEMFKGLIWIFV